jgi:hypothetical protein
MKADADLQLGVEPVLDFDDLGDVLALAGSLFDVVRDLAHLETKSDE